MKKLIIHCPDCSTFLHTNGSDLQSILNFLNATPRMPSRVVMTPDYCISCLTLQMWGKITAAD